jgi:hypothetical protein
MLRGHHINPEPDPDVRPEAPGPDVALSPLASAQGALRSNKFPNCLACRAAPDCMTNVLGLGTFARPECEMALVVTFQDRKNKNSMSFRVLEVIEAHPEGLTTGQIRRFLGVPQSSISTALETLVRREQVRADRSNPGQFVYFPGSLIP